MAALRDGAFAAIFFGFALPLALVSLAAAFAGAAASPASAVLGSVFALRAALAALVFRAGFSEVFAGSAAAALALTAFFAAGFCTDEGEFAAVLPEAALRFEAAAGAAFFGARTFTSFAGAAVTGSFSAAGLFDRDLAVELFSPRAFAAPVFTSVDVLAFFAKIRSLLDAQAASAHV